MIILDSATNVLRARISAAPAATNPVFVFAYGDEPLGSGQATHNSSGVLNGTTNVNLVGAPASNTSRLVKSGFICNADSAAVTLTIEFYDGANARKVWGGNLASGATLTFSDSGWAGGLSADNTGGSAITALMNSSGTVNIDCSLGDYFTLLGMSANVTSLTFSNLPGVGLGRTIDITLSQDATGGRTLALPASFKAIGNSDNAIQSAANAKTKIIATTLDGGTTWAYSMAKVAA